MAKKKASGHLKQQKIEGTFDPVPDEVQGAADDYVRALRLRQKNQEKENVRRDEVLALMEEHGVEIVELDDEKVLVLERGKSKPKIKRRTDIEPEEEASAE